MSEANIFSSSEETNIIKASRREGLIEVRKNVSYRRESLENLPPQLERYWKAKSEYNFEDSDLTLEEMKQIEQEALEKADEVLENNQNYMKRWIAGLCTKN